MRSRRRDGLECIIKTIALARLTKREARMVRQEAKLLATLRHPQIVSHLESFVEPRRHELCIVMEFCERGDLEQWVATRKRAGRCPSEDVVVHMFAQLCMALEYVHAKRVVHRDVKTSNVFLTRDQAGNDVVKLGDFGISKVLDRSGELCATNIGTPCYMAPELLDDRPYDYKVDVWSVGCVLYELAALKRAFEARSVPALVKRVIGGPAPRLASADLAPLLASLLAKNPALRPDISDVLATPVVQRAADKVRSWTEPAAPVAAPPRDSQRAPPRFVERAAKAERAALERAERARQLRRLQVVQEPLKDKDKDEDEVEDDDEDEDDDSNYRMLGDGWWLKRDLASNKWFYVHEATGHSQWDPPSPDASRRQESKLADFVARERDEAEARRVRDAVRARVEESRRERIRKPDDNDDPADDKEEEEVKEEESTEWLGNLEARMCNLRDQLAQIRKPAVYRLRVPFDIGANAQAPDEPPEAKVGEPLADKIPPSSEAPLPAADDDRLSRQQAPTGDQAPPGETNPSTVLKVVVVPPRNEKPPFGDERSIRAEEPASPAEEPVAVPEPKESQPSRHPEKNRPRKEKSSRAAARDARRTELRKRIAADRNRRKASVQVEVLAPPEPRPLPPKRAVSLYEYLASKNEVENVLRRADERRRRTVDPEPPGGSDRDVELVLGKLRQSLEKQRSLTGAADSARMIRAALGLRSHSDERPPPRPSFLDDDDDDDEFLDCVATLGENKAALRDALPSIDLPNQPQQHAEEQRDPSPKLGRVSPASAPPDAEEFRSQPEQLLVEEEVEVHGKYESSSPHHPNLVVT
ncbi:hypothetical protein CTAYLR_007777 [Chrysophaeum taylorii]|uniref:non-specific serine/threonine protein kinase n=1 Tax=Chrysophaeum taylorii TaxID=2483200 RepID=A0AAD7ULT7_9STRA|nr:hypothetical protein CTAYLR_007777 [Chrysophaeum taylorii]